MKYIIFSILYAALVIQTTSPNVVCYSTINGYNVCLDHKRNLSWIQ